MRLWTLSWLLSFYIDLWCSARLLTDYLAFGLFDSISLLPSRRWYYWWFLLAMAIGSWGCRESPVIAIRDKVASVAFLWPPWCGVDEMWMTVLSLPKTTGQSISIYENVMINYWMELFTKPLNTWFMRRSSGMKFAQRQNILNVYDHSVWVGPLLILLTNLSCLQPLLISFSEYRYYLCSIVYFFWMREKPFDDPLCMTSFFWSLLSVTSIVLSWLRIYVKVGNANSTHRHDPSSSEWFITFVWCATLMQTFKQLA